MSFWQQRGNAISGEIEDFFRVKAQTVILMLPVIAGLVGFAVLRAVYGYSNAWFWPQTALLGVVLWLASKAFTKP